MTYTVLWIGWIAYFAIVEGKALTHPHDGDTLSEYVWRWFMVRRQDQTGSRFSILAHRLVLLGLLAWLFAHFVSGGQFP